LLLQRGAVPTAVDKNGSTPAHIAGMAGHFADEALLSKAADLYSKAQAAEFAENAIEKQRSLSSRVKQQCDITNATDSSGTSSNSSSSSSSKEANSTAEAVYSSSSNDAAATTAASNEAVESTAKQKKQKARQPCANIQCKKLTTKLCRRCAAVYYCSTECQKVCFRDAKHRAQCEEVASAIV
jgi:ankyrin repeat protein